MDPNEIRDIMEMSGKLQSSFRHIRYLCGRYLEMENGGNPYHLPYGQFSMPPPLGYPTHSHFGHESFYPPYSNGYPPQIQPPSVNLNNVPKNFPKIKPSEPPNKLTSNLTSDRIQPLKLQKQSSSQKRPQSISLESKDPKPSQKPINPTSSLKIPQSGFEVFLNKKRDQIKKEYPQLEEKQLCEIMSEVWKSFSQAEKDPYEAEWRKIKRGEKKEDNKSGNKMMTVNEIAKSLKNSMMK